MESDEVRCFVCILRTTDYILAIRNTCGHHPGGRRQPARVLAQLAGRPQDRSEPEDHRRARRDGHRRLGRPLVRCHAVVRGADATAIVAPDVADV